jgi:hypothetical protein
MQPGFLFAPAEIKIWRIFYQTNNYGIQQTSMASANSPLTRSAGPPPGINRNAARKQTFFGPDSPEQQ